MFGEDVLADNGEVENIVYVDGSGSVYTLGWLILHEL